MELAIGVAIILAVVRVAAPLVLTVLCGKALCGLQERWAVSS